MNYKKIISADKNDNYSSILKKIMLQDKIENKIGVYHLFEYTKPHIVHSRVFLEYLSIWDKDLYDFLINNHPVIKKRYSNEILEIISRLYYIIKKIIINASYIAFSIALYLFLIFPSLIIIFKLMEFIVKLLNGNLDNFHIFESPL